MVFIHRPVTSREIWRIATLKTMPFLSRRYILTWNYAVRYLKIRSFQQQTIVFQHIPSIHFQLLWLFFFRGIQHVPRPKICLACSIFLGDGSVTQHPKRQFEDPQNWDCDILRAIKLLLQGIEASVVAAVGQLGSCWWWVLDGLDGRFEQKNTVQNSMSFIHGSSDLPPTHGKWIVTWGEMGAATYKSYK